MSPRIYANPHEFLLISANSRRLVDKKIYFLGLSHLPPDIKETTTKAIATHVKAV